MERLKLMYNLNTNVNELINEVNKFRLLNKNKWYVIIFVNETSGEQTSLKIYNTWIQTASKPLFDTSMDKSVTEFKNIIAIGLNSLLKFY